MVSKANDMISASLVLYNNNPKIFEPAITSFLKGCENGIIWISDNSPKQLENPIFSCDRVRYFKNEENLGFGAGHNQALKRIRLDSDLHLILNPDVEFSTDVLPELIRLMDADDRIGAVMPRIIYPDGSPQHLAKLLPTPLDLFFRRFIPFNSIKNFINRRYELRDLDISQPIEVPAISGCFLLARTSVLQRIGGFDERYFMYMEDFDLVRRIAKSHKILFAPQVEVVHHYAQGSYFKKTLLLYHIKSAIKYFNKWGWVFDATRKHSNQRALRQIQTLGKVIEIVDEQ